MTEPPTIQTPLITLPNVIATPHSAASTHETQTRSSLMVVQQLKRVLDGGEAENPRA